MRVESSGFSANITNLTAAPERVYGSGFGANIRNLTAAHITGIVTVFEVGFRVLGFRV